MAGPRTQGAPPEALAPDIAAAELARLLAGRRRVVWGPLREVRSRLAEHAQVEGGAVSVAPFRMAGDRDQVAS